MKLRKLLQLTIFMLATTLSASALAQDKEKKEGGDETPPPGPSVQELKKKKDIDDKPRKMVRLYFDQKYPEGEAAVKLAEDAISGTEIVVERAENIARRQGQSTKGLRNMHVYQLAAQKAADAGEAPVAVYLTLRARGFARDLVLANNGRFPDELQGTDAQKAKEAGGVTDKEADPFVEDAREEVGTVEELLESK
ncbi:MAG: hypothetical protein ACQEVA_10815 [Myxococcota bacterium]